MTSASGSDVSSLPQRYPKASWLPIEAPLLGGELRVRVKVNGRETTGVLDTGAMSTIMSVPVAVKLGVLSEDTPLGEEVRAVDAHGDLLQGERVPLGELAVGAHRWVNVTAVVLGSHPDLFLIGADLLQDVDLYLAADEGLVGLFEAGAAPKEPGDLVIPLDRGQRQLTVPAQAPAKGGADVRFSLIVDTGASDTSVPAFVGINEGLPADLGYQSKTLAVGGVQENRGRFVLEPLRLGRGHTPVGRVLAHASTMNKGERLGLLGNDVLRRFHARVSFRDAELRLSPLAPRPALRARGPGGSLCEEPGSAEGERRGRPCIRAQLSVSQADLPADALPGVCLDVDIDRAYAGRTVEVALALADASGRPRLEDGVLRAHLTVGDQGARPCFSLWRELERLGVAPGAPLSLRWVRVEGATWPCDPLMTQCLAFVGPLATSTVR